MEGYAPLRDTIVQQPILLSRGERCVDLHQFALHHVFLGRINKSLTAFKDGWNMHGLRTERNHTALQLFTTGALRLRNFGLEAMDLFDAVDSSYGNDDEGDAPSTTDPQV